MSATTRFLRRLAVAALAGLVLWALVRPALDGTISNVAEAILRAFEHPRTTHLVVVEHRAEVRRADLRTDSAVPAVPLTGIHANTVVLLALFWALARPWSPEQLRRLLVGWSLLILVQSLNLVFHVKVVYSSGLGEWSAQHYSELARALWGYLRHAADLPVRFALPFALWAWLNWDQVSVIAGLRTDPVASAKGTPRSSRQPGVPSGRKRRD